MTGSRACAQLRSELGVYLVGAIAPGERPAVEAHLASCASCRNQLAQLAGLPALLRRIPADDVASLSLSDLADAGSTLPEGHLSTLLNRAARRRHRRRSRLAVAAVAGVALAAGFAAGMAAAVGTPPAQPPTSAVPSGAVRSGAITARGRDPGTGVSAVVQYAGRPWGVQLSVQVAGIAAGTSCVLEVIGASGRETVAGSWTIAAPDKNAWYHASSSVPVVSVRGFVVTADGRALVTVGGRRIAN